MTYEELVKKRRQEKLDKSKMTPAEIAAANKEDSEFVPARPRKSLFETAVAERGSGEKSAAEDKPVIDWSPVPKEDQQIESDFMRGKQDPIEPEEDLWNLNGPKVVEKDASADSETSDTSEPPAPETPAVDPKEARINSMRQQWEEDNEGFNQEARDTDSELMRGIQEAKAMYQTSKDSEANKQLWESMIQGIAHIAAGVIGHQTGLNLGGLKFNQTGWDRRRDQIFNEMQSSKQDAYRKMSEDRQRIADKRAAAYQGYKIGSDELDRALRKEQTEFSQGLAEGKLKVDQAKAVTDRIKAIRDGNDEVKKQQLKDYNRVVGNVDSALQALKKDSSKENAADLKLQASEANKRAAALELPEPYPDLTNIVKPGMIWGTNVSKFEDVTKQLQDHLGGPEEDPQIAKFAQDNNISYAEAVQVIEKRRAQ
jgi:hypothetical protein